MSRWGKPIFVIAFLCLWIFQGIVKNENIKLNISQSHAAPKLKFIVLIYGSVKWPQINSHNHWSFCPQIPWWTHLSLPLHVANAAYNLIISHLQATVSLTQFCFTVNTYIYFIVRFMQQRDINRDIWLNGMCLRTCNFFNF